MLWKTFPKKMCIVFPRYRFQISTCARKSKAFTHKHIIDISSFKMVLITLGTHNFTPRAKLWKLVMKCKKKKLTFEPFFSECTFFMLQLFFLPGTYPVNSNLPVVAQMYKIHNVYEVISPLFNCVYDKWNSVFFSFPLQPLLRRQILLT